MRLYLTSVASPLGEIRIAAHDGGVRALDFIDQWPKAEERLRRGWPNLAVASGDPIRAADHVAAYFEGEFDALARLTIDPEGTPFQHRVWAHLRQIPPGRTITYRDLASRIDCPRGLRAVGSANRLNPLAIVIPCHRVVGSDGSLRGYAGGVARKRWLIEHEQNSS